MIKEMPGAGLFLSKPIRNGRGQRNDCRQSHICPTADSGVGCIGGSVIALIVG
jgi:hypothetical protein